MEINLIPRDTQTLRIEGPTKAQARRMAAYRQSLLASAEAALKAGNDEVAFDRDCEAMDIEMDLRPYGFNIDTGHPAR
jgi:hypothetical protein